MRIPTPTIGRHSRDIDDSHIKENVSYPSKHYSGGL